MAMDKAHIQEDTARGGGGVLFSFLQNSWNDQHTYWTCTCSCTVHDCTLIFIHVHEHVPVDGSKRLIFQFISLVY